MGRGRLTDESTGIVDHESRGRELFLELLLSLSVLDADVLQGIVDELLVAIDRILSTLFL